MQIVRPANGFRVNEHPRVLRTIDCLKDNCPWLALAYANIQQLLRMAGHRVGHAIKSGDQTQRVYIEADPDSGENRMYISYRVFGDTLTIKAVLVLAANSLSTDETPDD
jgi:hypothetical protein